MLRATDEHEMHPEDQVVVLESKSESKTKTKAPARPRTKGTSVVGPFLVHLFFGSITSKSVLFVVFTPGPFWHHRAKTSRFEGI